jgi:hypothetical protein
MKFQYVILITLFIVGGFFTACSNDQRVDDPAGMHRCIYKSYSGELTVEEVRYSPGTGDKSYLLTYKFKADSQDIVSQIKPTDLETDWVTAEQISTFDIKPGKKFRADVKFIVSGTCAPGPYLEEPKNWR